MLFNVQGNSLRFVADYVKIEVTSANKDDIYLDLLGALLQIRNQALL